MRAEVRLPRRVQRRVAAVAQEQIQLDLVVARAIEQELVVSRAIRTYQLRILYPVDVLPTGRMVSNEIAEGVALLSTGRLAPVRLAYL